MVRRGLLIAGSSWQQIKCTPIRHLVPEISCLLLSSRELNFDSHNPPENGFRCQEGWYLVTLTLTDFEHILTCYLFPFLMYVVMHVS